MKQLLIAIAALVLVGCGEPQNAQIIPLQDIPVSEKPKLLESFIADLERTKRERMRAENQTKPYNIHADAWWGKTEFVRQHLVNGVDVNLKDKDGNTPLHRAALGINQNIEVIKLLIEKGGDVNARDDGLSTPLHYSIGDTEISKILIENGADISAKDEDGYTALHNAAFDNEIRIIEILISKGADVNQLTQHGESSMDKAVENEATEAINLLRKHGSKPSETHYLRH